MLILSHVRRGDFYDVRFAQGETLQHLVLCCGFLRGSNHRKQCSVGLGLLDSKATGKPTGKQRRLPFV